MMAPRNVGWFLKLRLFKGNQTEPIWRYLEGLDDTWQLQELRNLCPQKIAYVAGFPKER